jgi:hypothetical protein
MDVVEKRRQGDGVICGTSMSAYLRRCIECLCNVVAAYICVYSLLLQYVYTNQRVSYARRMGIMNDAKNQLSICSLQLDGVSLANCFAISEQQCWYRDESNRKEAEHAISPTETKRLVHLWSSKRQHSAEEAS